MLLALFGGTFDPVHLGHLHMATLAKDVLALDEVRFIPCQISPHKIGSTPASPEDRLEMLRLALADTPWATIDDLELRRPGPSFSYQTAEETAARFPEARLFWIMGGDQWAALPRWKHPEKIAELVEFIVIARNDTPRPRPGYRMHLLTGEHPASSTEIRLALSSGNPAPWLSPAVAGWIEHRHLYGT
ncbi:MAG: nicotinate (nicotinamide) nucleotide adenylyltransferase [Luteolibacter sp.]